MVQSSPKILANEEKATTIIIPYQKSTRTEVHCPHIDTARALYLSFSRLDSVNDWLIILEI